MGGGKTREVTTALAGRGAEDAARDEPAAAAPPAAAAGPARADKKAARAERMRLKKEARRKKAKKNGKAAKAAKKKAARRKAADPSSSSSSSSSSSGTSSSDSDNGSDSGFEFVRRVREKALIQLLLAEGGDRIELCRATEWLYGMSGAWREGFVVEASAGPSHLFLERECVLAADELAEIERRAAEFVGVTFFTGGKAY